MKIKNCLLSGVLGGMMMIGQSVEAGGSLSKAELVAVLLKSGTMGTTVTATFELDEIAVGTRLGRQYEGLSAYRIGPYYVKAKPKGAAGDFNVMLRIDTAARFFGPNGKELPNGGVGAPGDSTISEVVTGWSVLPVETDMDSGEVPVKPDGGLLKEGGVEAEKDVYNDVLAQKLVMETMELEYEDGVGSVKRWRDSENRVRRVQFSHGTDHSGMVHDVYYDVQGGPRFLMNTLSSWSFVPGKPDVTMDKTRERRFYISAEGLTLKVLEKYYEGEGEVGIKAAAEAAKNIELKPEAYATRKFVVYTREMRIASRAKFMALTGEMISASARLLEPAPSIEEKHWTEVKEHVSIKATASDRMELEVLEALIRKGLIGGANENAEGNYAVIPEVVRTEAGVDGEMKAWVVVTATGLADDAIEGERYLVCLEGPVKGQLMGVFLGRQVRNWPERGVQGWR